MSKKVQLKSQEELKELVKSGEIQLLGGSEDGGVTHYGFKENGITHVMTVRNVDYGEEFLVVPHERPIYDQSYENRKIFFKEQD